MLFFNMYEDSSSTSATQAEKEEVDARSIYVGNVRFQQSLSCLISISMLPNDILNKFPCIFACSSLHLFDIYIEYPLYQIISI